MGLLQKLKSALGLDASGSPSTGTNTPKDVDVTVEREPSTESEDAVKGTETDTSEKPNGDAQGTESATDADETVAEAAEPTTEEADSESEETESVVENDAAITEIKGVGPAYAERLENAGISTLSDLAVADADELAESTDLSPNRISGWIDQARSF